MTEETKITLSAKELELVCNTDWILTKHAIIGKVYDLLGSVATNMKAFIHENPQVLPVEIEVNNPKISRGENYRLLPYIMLDYPRHFTKEATLAIRTFFWWGNFFSINLQLSGTYKENALANLKKNFTRLQQNEYWICVGSDPWQHHFEADNYIVLHSLTAEEFATILHRESFVKIAKKIPLQHWDTAATLIELSFKEMVRLTGFNFPNDEKGLSPGIPITGFDL